jgi:hypothetical protein
MSSHREAPAISKDPVADSTDLYAFVSPDVPGTVTIIANYIPLEGPAGGPNFYEFGDDVLYEIHIDNDGDAEPDISLEFRFNTQVRNQGTFLYNTGPIASLDDANWNRRQTYDLTWVDHGRHVIGTGLTMPPVNIGPRSTPNYTSLASAAIHTLANGIVAFAGQRRDPFFVDLGSIFDLAALRPFQNLHLIPTPAAPGVDAIKGFNVHSIAVQIPLAMVTRDGKAPTDPAKPQSVIGVWTSASRQKASIRAKDGTTASGPWVQVSRLGNPLINEVIIPMASKDDWNGDDPSDDEHFVSYYAHPELAGLIPVLYPGVFPNLAAYSKERADLEAILLTGIPSGVVPGFQNFTGRKPADLLRLNLAVPPAVSPNPIGLVAGDPAGFPNGRRVFDDIVAIELKAVAGATIPLVDPSFTPDGAASLLADGTAPEPGRYLSTFPYVGTPLDGYNNPAS